MAHIVILPKQGQSVESCTILGWKKRVGDSVKTGEVICEVETDKATFEVESTGEGTLLAVFYEPGSQVPVLAPIAAIGKPGEKVENPASPAASPAAASPAPQAAAPAKAAAQAVAIAPAATLGAKVMASPRAKALAASQGLSLSGLQGSGPSGRIIERDVKAAIAGGAPRAAGAQPAARAAMAPIGTGAVTEIKLKGVRKLIADRMLASITTTAQLTMNSSADAREMQALRRKLKDSPEELGLRDITLNDMILYAVSRALLRHPDLNAQFSGDTIRQLGDVHLGFAVDTPRGLVVPVIKNAQGLSLKQISRESGRLAKGCREGGTTPDELSGGTFTVSNLGSMGVESFTPILNPPQVAILGVGTIALKPVQGKDGAITHVPHMGLSLTVNHQVVDGAPGARFLQTLAGMLAHIELLLAE